MSEPAAPPGAAPPAAAPGVRFEARADRTTATVGDPVVLTFTLRRPETTKVVTFDADRALGSLTVLNQVEGEPRRLEDGTFEEVRTLTVAAYATGKQEIPAVRLVTRDAAGQEGSVSSAPLAFEVASVLKEGETAPADLKQPFEMAERLVWPWVALALVLLAVAGFLWWRRRRRRPGIAAPVVEAPPRPEHEVAYEELQRLLSAGLLERGALKEFYIELAEILRRYLGRRYDLDTFERTTWEILESLKGAKVGAPATALAAGFLGACDLVKFAKHAPGQDETRRTVEQAYRLVDETRRREAPAADAAAAPGADPAAAGRRAGGAA